jgi:hypothetical protein
MEANLHRNPISVRGHYTPVCHPLQSPVWPHFLFYLGAFVGHNFLKRTHDSLKNDFQAATAMVFVSEDWWLALANRLNIHF